MQVTALRDFAKARGLAITTEYSDHGISGTKSSRPALDQLMNDARKRKFDTVLVFRFDRFARSSRHLILALEEFKVLGIDFISYSENIDTSSPLGKAIFTIISAMSELERNVIVERVKSGLENAKRKGKQLGRPCASFDSEKALSLRKSGMSLRDIAAQLHISKSKLGEYFKLSRKPQEVAA